MSSTQIGLKFPIKFHNASNLLPLLLLIFFGIETSANDKISKSKKAVVSVKEVKGSYRISNELDNNVELFVIHNNQPTEKIQLQPGEKAYFWSTEMELGSYTLFVSGQYSEVIKLISWIVDK
jgi:hypothetical protein